MKRFRGRLVFKAHRLLFHSNLGSRVPKKKKKVTEYQQCFSENKLMQISSVEC